MKIAILGFAGQGQAAYEYWNTPGNDITVCDQAEDLAVVDGLKTRLGKDYLKGLDEFDLLVRTPALHPRDITAANPDAPDILKKVTTVTSEFMRVCPTKNTVGITGTKGKGTTSTLIAKILEAAGKRVHLGGNIGTPPLELLKNNIQPDDWVVLELANFQLIDLNYSPHVAVCVMVVPEHMDWHPDMEEYVTAKQRLFLNQTPDDLAVFNRNNAHSTEIAGITMAEKVSYEVPGPGAEPTKREGAYLLGNTVYMNEIAVCETSDIALLGRHNIENVCAAIAATWEIIGHSTEIIKKVLAGFTGLEHRLELVREASGVQYYDDSFGTTPETAIVAIQAFEQPKVVILGGSDKGAEFNDLAHVVKANNVKAVVLIGDTAPKIQKALLNAGYEDIIDGGTDMDAIVKTAAGQAASGDVVLLSTGCASFGLFKNYKHRGEEFQKAVRTLS